MKVLVVDDEAIVRLALKRALELKGHTVTEAENGEEGKKKWLNESPDLVFLDILMPGQSGLQVLQDIGDLNESVVVLMSAYSGVHNESEMAELQADHFLKKPFEDIFRAIEMGERLVHERQNKKS